MESYLLVLASLILLVPIILYLPLGITFKGKMIIIFGAIIIASIGVYANVNFPLWQTAGMLLLLIIAATFFMKEKFEGLIFDQEGNDLTAYESDGPVEELEEKADLIHFIGIQNQGNGGLANQEQRKVQLEEINAEIGDEAAKKEEARQEIDVLETDPLIDIENKQQVDTDVLLDEENELLQSEPPLITEDELDVMDTDSEEHLTDHSETAQMPDSAEDERIEETNEIELYGSLTNDEVEFLLNREELTSSDDLSVHYMEDIEILLEDEDEDLKASAELMEEEPTVDSLINVYEEGDLPLIIDELEGDKEAEDLLSGEHAKSDLVDLEAELSKDIEAIKLEPIGDTVEWLISDDEGVETPFDLNEETQVNDMTVDVSHSDDIVTLSDESIQQKEQEPSKTTPEQAELQSQLFDTFFNQLKLAKISCSDEEYESLIKKYLTDELPDQMYYQFSTLLLDHYIEKQQWAELKQNIFELQKRFEQYPILTEQLDYLYQTYCA